MYLSRIEIFGFKSFAQKLVVELGPGMTAVVGPNGCGKTNISDAVRWALGEHNIRMLRGKLLEDVIFAGSPRRDPLGMAEVTLTFSNAEGAFNLGLAEVSITRRVFRSGESEFLLNGVPCRLKEITDQLMDRGLGHRGYAIIEREMVERVLEDTSRERRALLEEAAGIARYKAREKAARRKLELTEQDLRRLQDIVGEVEKRVESLRRQVGKAKRYQEYEARLREAETLLVRTEYRELKDRGARIAEERREARLRVEALRAELRTAENEREVVRAARDEADRALSRAEADVAAVTREATELEGKVEVLRERRRSFLEGAQRSEQEAENHAGRRGECLRRHQEGQAEEGRLRIEAQNLVGKQESEAKALADLDRDYGERQAALEERRSANMTALEERVSRSQELQSSHRTLEQLTEKEKEHRRREEELLGEKEHLESEVGERASTLKQLAEALLSAEEDRNRARRHLAELETARAEREERERELGVELRGIESHVAVLKELDERFEGFSRSVRELMQEARAGGAGTRGVRGLVGELLSSGDERVTAALEVALEEGLDCVVTEDLASARDLPSPGQPERPQRERLRRDSGQGKRAPRRPRPAARHARRGGPGARLRELRGGCAAGGRVPAPSDRHHRGPGRRRTPRRPTGVGPASFRDPGRRELLLARRRDRRFGAGGGRLAFQPRAAHRGDGEETGRGGAEAPRGR
jgi:chromosome segregation protein